VGFPPESFVGFSFNFQSVFLLILLRALKLLDIEQNYVHFVVDIAYGLHYLDARFLDFLSLKLQILFVLELLLIFKLDGEFVRVYFA
jgi:hypothetical protein